MSPKDSRVDRSSDETPVEVPNPQPKKAEEKAGWDKATEVFMFTCTSCNESKRSQKMLNGKCEACFKAV